MQHTYRSIRPHSLAVTCVCRSYLLPTDERQHFVAETDVQLKIFFLFFSSPLLLSLSFKSSWCVKPISIEPACPFATPFAMLEGAEKERQASFIPTMM